MIVDNNFLFTDSWILKFHSYARVTLGTSRERMEQTQFLILLFGYLWTGLQS